MIGALLGNLSILILSILGCSAFKKRIENFFIPSVSFIVFVIYVSGIFGNLRIGALLVSVVALAGLIYSITVFARLKKEEKKEFINLTVTPGSLFFIIATLFFSIRYYGMLCWGWDEFSHWSDIVKVYTLTGKLGSVQTQSLFASYIPGMPIFEYYFQALNNGIFAGNNYSEWLLYASYHCFTISVLTLFFEKTKWKDIFPVFFLSVALLLLPCVLFEDFYNYVYIDPIIGILASAAMAYILTCEKKPWIYDVNIFSLTALIVLSKSAGFLFAVFVVVFYVIDLFIEKREKLVLKIIPAIISLILPKLMWSVYVKSSNIPVKFSGKVDLAELAGILLGRDNSYRTEVLKTFIINVKYATVNIPNIGLHLDYIWFQIVCVVLIATLLIKNKKKTMGILSAIILLMQTWIYMFGTMVAYMFKFSESEALSLASFVRYISVGHLALFGVLVLLAADSYRKINKKVLLACLLVLMIMVLPKGNMINLITGKTVSKSIEYRIEYDKDGFEQKIKSLPEGSRIFFISQQDNGIDYWIMKYVSRPNLFNQNFQWSITTENPGEYDRLISEKDLINELKLNYDYVAVYKSDERLSNDYSTLFPERDNDKTIYKIDKESTKLIRYK